MHRTCPEANRSKNRTNPGKNPVKSWLFKAGNKTGIYYIGQFGRFFYIVIANFKSYSIEELELLSGSAFLK